MSRLNDIIPLIITDSIKTGIPASLSLAQYYIESADGTAELPTEANAYFGIKWRLGETKFPPYWKETKEWENGQYVTRRLPFRHYPDMATSVRDHSLFLHKDRYKDIWGVRDYKLACELIKTCGYATSPSYIKTLTDKVEAMGFAKYDKEPYMRQLKVCLSPSSQEHNQYAGIAKTEEQACNLIADHVQRILMASGVDVLRNNPADGPAGHTALSNAWGADYHVPIHTNASGGQGTEVFCWNPADDTSYSTRLAKELYSRVSKLTPSPDRGLQKNQSFYEIKHTKASCAYVEVEFHDSKDGAAWILANIENIAREIAEGILTTAGINPAQIGTTKTVTASSLRVRQTPSLIGKQIGSLPRGTKVTVLQTSNGWAKIPQGFVFAKHLA